MTIELAAGIALAIALGCLFLLVYVALYWRGGESESPRDVQRKTHYARWEDRL